MVTPKGSMSTEGETLQVSVLPYRCSVYPLLVRARCQSYNQVPATHVHLHVCGRNLITGLTSAASPRVDIPCTCKVGQKLGMSLPLLTCYPSAWPSRLLYRRDRKFRRDLRITLYFVSSAVKRSSSESGRNSVCPEDEGSMFHRNVGKQLPNITVLKLRVMQFQQHFGPGEASKPASATTINAWYTLVLIF